MEPDSSARWNSYDDSFREDAHQLLAWGYTDARPQINSSLEEPDITGFIAEEIDGRLSAPDIDERFDRYSVKEDNPTKGEGRTGKRRRRLDIIIESNHRPRNKPRPKYVFEAKRLLRSSHRIDDYVGTEGLKRFIDGRYAAEYPEAAMVGYIQSDSPSYWLERLEKQFEKDSTDQFKLNGKLYKKTVISSIPNEWASNHRRVKRTEITVYHIFLDCSTLS